MERWTFGANDGVPMMVGGNLGMCRPVISLILPPNVVGFVSVGPTAPCVALWEDFSSIGLELVRGGAAITGAECVVHSSWNC